MHLSQGRPAWKEAAAAILSGREWAINNAILPLKTISHDTHGPGFDGIVLGQKIPHNPSRRVIASGIHGWRNSEILLVVRSFTNFGGKSNNGSAPVR